MDRQTLTAVLDKILSKQGLVEKKFLEVEDALYTNTKEANQRYAYVLGQLDAVDDFYASVMLMLLEAHD